MTPTHPHRIGTHRRIADILEREPASAPDIAKKLGMNPSTIGLALGKMESAGYVRKGRKQPRKDGAGRPTQLWRLAPGVASSAPATEPPPEAPPPVAVPAMSGGRAAWGTLSPAAYVARVVDTLRTGPKTRDELMTATRMGSTQMGSVLTHLTAEGCISATPRKTRGRTGFLYALVSEPRDPSAVTIRKYVNPHLARKKPPPDEEAIEFDGTSGTFVLGTVPSTETAACHPAKATVTLAACLDGYVTATALNAASKCNGCSVGRARRAAYAGADFEESDDE